MISSSVSTIKSQNSEAGRRGGAGGGDAGGGRGGLCVSGLRISVFLKPQRGNSLQWRWIIETQGFWGDYIIPAVMGLRRLG